MVLDIRQPYWGAQECLIELFTRSLSHEPTSPYPDIPLLNVHTYSSSSYINQPNMELSRDTASLSLINENICVDEFFNAILVVFSATYIINQTILIYQVSIWDQF